MDVYIHQSSLLISTILIQKKKNHYGIAKNLVVNQLIGTVISNSDNFATLKANFKIPQPSIDAPKKKKKNLCNIKDRLNLYSLYAIERVSSCVNMIPDQANFDPVCYSFKKLEQKTME